MFSNAASQSISARNVVIASNNNSSVQNTLKVANVTEKSPEDIPKDELVQLCMKMNKRMQAMEVKGQELVKKKNSLHSDKIILLEFLKSIPLALNIEEDQSIDIESIRTLWSAREYSQQEYISSLEQSKLIDTLEDMSSTPLKPLPLEPSQSQSNNDQDINTYELNTETSPQLDLEEAKKTISNYQSRFRKLDMENERLQSRELSMKEIVSALENKVSSKTTQIDKLQKEFDSQKSQLEERVLSLQMTINSMKSREESKEHEMSGMRKHLEEKIHLINTLNNTIEEKDLAIQSNKEIIQALQSRLMDVTPEFERAKERIRESERISGASMLLKVEQEALANSLRRDLRAAMDAREETNKRNKELEEFRIKAEGQLLRLASLNEQINILQSGLEDKSSLVTRLRTEAQVNERNHAMRTAMLATSEAQLESLQRELKVKDDTARESIERVSILQSRLTSCESKLTQQVEEMNAQVTVLEKRLLDQAAAFECKILSINIDWEDAMEACKRDFSKKSNLARALLSEREEEVKGMTAKMQEMQAEISSGAPSERKIFQFAQSQSQRDTAHGLHSDMREVAFQQLQRSLTAKDLELSHAQHKHDQIASEIAELRRTSRRETVNMDYLKNIMLQYMTFPIHSQERISLVPVISTLLQFNPKESHEVERAGKDPNWSLRPVKEIKRSLHRASQSSNANSSNDDTSKEREEVMHTTLIPGVRVSIGNAGPSNRDNRKNNTDALISQRV